MPVPQATRGQGSKVSGSSVLVTCFQHLGFSHLRNLSTSRGVRVLLSAFMATAVPKGSTVPFFK